MDRPIGLIAAHCLSDSVHRDNGLYADYYSWLINTVEIVSGITHVQWLVKPHPVRQLLYEEGVIEGIAQATRGVSIVPDSVRIVDVLEIADAVVTVRGTVALEAIQYDIRPILAGSAWFMDAGFSEHCTSIPHYRNVLESVEKKTAMGVDEKLLAAKILYWFRESAEARSGLFGFDRNAGLSRNDAANHDLKIFSDANEYLAGHTYMSDPYYKKLLHFFKENESRLSMLD